MYTLLILSLAWQLEKPPEFSAAGGFKKSDVDAAIDSAAHTSGQKSQSAKWMVRALTDWTQSASAAEAASWAKSMDTLSRGALAEAADAFAQGARGFPAAVRQKAAYGASLFAQGQYERAATVLLTASRAHPRELRLIPYLVEVLDADPRVAAQLKAWADAYPKHAEAQWAYGVALMVPSPTESAKRLRQSAALSQDRDARPYLALARLEPDRAVAHLEKAVHADDANAEAHYRLAIAYQQRNDRGRAAQHMERYKALKR